MNEAIIYDVSCAKFSKGQTFKILESKIPDLKKQGITILVLWSIHPMGELEKRGESGSAIAIKDYYDINPDFGTSHEFKSLVRTVHQYGLRIIIDFVADYMAWDNQILLEHPDWFQHNAEGAILSPRPEMYDVAQLDLTQHEPRKKMIAIMEYWVQNYDMDGFRCRMVESIPVDFWNAARNELEKIKPVILISENPQPEYHLEAFDITNGIQLNSLVQSTFIGSLPASALNDSIKAEIYRFPQKSLHLHATEAQPCDYLNYQKINLSDFQSLTASSILAFTLPGVPMICHGYEAGNTDQLHTSSLEQINKGKIVELNKLLVIIRQQNKALQNGSYKFIPDTASKKIFSFLRTNGNDLVFTVLSFDQKEIKTRLHVTTGSCPRWRDELSGTSYQMQDSTLSLTIAPFGAMILTPAYERNNE